MDQPDTNNMTQSSSYPDPSPGASHGAHPFFTSQQHMPAPVEGRMPKAPTAPMHGGKKDAHIQPNHHVHDYRQTQPTTPQQLAQQGLEVNQTTGHNNTDSSTKKKTKVSRACDECRRKKIRCDAESEDPGTRCSACSRSDTTCQFSRAPQKRGPSKGYIKELAERVNLLEYRSGAQPQEYQYTALQHSLSPSEVNSYLPQSEFVAPTSRKRTHSMVEGSPSLGHAPEQLQDYNRSYAPPPAMTFANSNMPIHENMSSQHRDLDLTRSINEALGGPDAQAVDEYYRQIHAHFPILPTSKARLQLFLDDARPTIREGLIAALGAAVKSGNSEADGARRTACDILIPLQVEEPTSRTTQENLIYLQALILMSIAGETGGPGRNQNTSWFNLAIGIAEHLELHISQITETGTSSDVDSSQRLGRRAWLILVMLDRWRAASVSRPLRIADESVQLIQSDHLLLGSSAYHLVRVSLILGHVSDGLMYNRADFSSISNSGRLLARVIKGEVDRFGEGLEQFPSSLRHINLAYLHVKLLSDRHLEVYASKSGEIVRGALNIVKLLLSDQSRWCTLTHHFAALAAMTLLEAIDHGDASASITAVKDLQYGLETGRLQHPHEQQGSRTAWSLAISRFISKSLESPSQKSSLNGKSNDRGGLQHLADAAVGADGGHVGEEAAARVEEQPVDWTILTSKGYLKIFE